MFSYLGIAFGCAIAQLCKLPSGWKHGTDDEREKAMNGLHERLSVLFQDSIKILGW